MALGQGKSFWVQDDSKLSQQEPFLSYVRVRDPILTPLARC